MSGGFCTARRWALRLALAAAAGSAAAHEMSMAEMAVRETARGEFTWQWTASNDRAAALAPGSADLVPRWPDGCRAQANRLQCGAAGLQGTLAIDGVGKSYSAALVKVVWLDGQSRVAESRHVDRRQLRRLRVRRRQAGGHHAGLLVSLVYR